MMEEARWTARSLPLPEAGGEARLLVCEATGGWAIALRRELVGLRLRVHETRSVVEAWAELARAPASFLVVELSRASVEPFLERLAWLEQDYPLARVAVVAERALEDCEWLVRAAGVVHFTTSPRQLTGLAQTVCRHLQTVPRSPRNLADEIWASLPWAKGQPKNDFCD